LDLVLGLAIRCFSLGQGQEPLPPASCVDPVRGGRAIPGGWAGTYKLTLRKQLGVDHPDTLCSMNNLAEVLSQQGNYAEAEAMHQQTLKLKEDVLGKDHPNTLSSMIGLAVGLSQQGKYAEAEALRLWHPASAPQRPDR
jgi:Tetratricopeptide repeat